MPDPIYGSKVVTKFINKLMWDGKKTIAQCLLYDAFDVIAERIKDAEPIDVFTQAVENVRPDIEVRSRRVGGAAYQVPMQVNRSRQQALAIRWLLQSARARPGKSMVEKLAAELADTAKGNSNTTKRREDTHRMAEANRAFAHYRW